MFSCLTIHHCVITSFPITWILFFKEYLWSPDICLHCMFAIPRTEAHRFWSENITGQPIDYEQSPHLHQRVRKERTRRVTGRSRSISREATKVKAEGDSDEEEEECLELEKAKKKKKSSELGWVSKATRNLKTKRGSNDNRLFPSSPGPLFQNESRWSAMQIKLIFTRKIVHLASFWKWGFLELGPRKWPIGALSRTFKT